MIQRSCVQMLASNWPLKNGFAAFLLLFLDRSTVSENRRSLNKKIMKLSKIPFTTFVDSSPTAHPRKWLIRFTAGAALLAGMLAQPAQAQSGVCRPLTSATLKSTIEALGFQPSEIGDQVYRFPVTQGDYKYRVNAYISSDLKWMSLNVGLLTKDQLTLNVAAKVLQLSHQRMNWYFVIDGDYLFMVHNYANECLDAAAVSRTVNAIVSEADRTRNAWDPRLSLNARPSR